MSAKTPADINPIKESIKLYAKQLHTPNFPEHELCELTKVELLREKSLTKVDLLIINELSYLTFNRYQSEILYQVISERFERSSIIITTNL